MTRTISLRTSLTLLLASASVFSFTIVAGAILAVRLPQIGTRAADQIGAAAQVSSGQLDRDLESVEARLVPLSQAVTARRPAQDIQLLMDALIGSRSLFDALLVADAKGQVSAWALPRQRDGARGATLRGVDLSADPLYRKLMQRRQGAVPFSDAPPLTVWSDSYRSVVTGQIAVGIAIDCGDEVVIAEVTQSRLLRSLRPVAVDEDMDLVILDARGRRLTPVRPPLDAVQDFGAIAGFRPLVSGLATPVDASVLDRSYVAAGVTSPRIGWITVAMLPTGMGLNSYRLTVVTVALGYVGALILSLVLAPLWAHWLSEPFRALARNAHRVAEGGDPEVGHSGLGPVREFRALAQDLDRMIAALRVHEAEVSRSEARLKSSLEYTPLVAIQWYDQDGRIIYWNQASTALYGYAAEEALGTVITERPLMFQSPQQGRDYVNLLADIERSGKAFGPAEFELRHKDGRIITVLATTYAIPGDDGQLVFVCMDVDITQRKVMERTLLENDLKLETIFNASPAPMTVSDARRDYQLVAANHAWEELFLRKREEVLGINGNGMRLWAHPEDRARFLAQVEAEGHVEDHEAWCLDGRGRSIFCEISAQIADIGDERLLLMMTVDITDRRRIERELQEFNVELEQRVEVRTEQLRMANEDLAETLADLRRAQDQLIESEKLAALGNLVAGVAHELNTPIGNALMAISTLGERLRDFQAIGREAMKYSDLERLVASVDMACAINQRNLQRAASLLSSFKQVAVDQTSAQRRKFDLREVVDEVLLTLQPSLKKQPIRIVVDVPGDLQMESYPGALGQVITNLISNAVVHAFEGQPMGHIFIQAQELHDQWMLFSISDDGVGIAEGLERRIFEPFFTTRLGQGGTGLGLHIVFNLVTRVLGGQIAVRNIEPRGACFELRLPTIAPLRAAEPATAGALVNSAS